MVLSRTTVCNKIPIKAPIWNGGKRKVGIATYKVGTHNEIEILVKDQYGNRIYPNTFYVSGEKLRSIAPEPLPKYPYIKVHQIAIDELELLERAN